MTVYFGKTRSPTRREEKGWDGYGQWGLGIIVRPLNIKYYKSTSTLECIYTYLTPASTKKKFTPYNIHEGT